MRVTAEAGFEAHPQPESQFVSEFELCDAGQPSVADIRRAALALLTGSESEPLWAAYRRQQAEGIEPDPRPLYAALGARGLLAPAWPVAYGGRGLTPRHQAAVVDALVEVGLPETLHTLSVQICGTFLLTAGSRAQRATLLPDLAAGRRFCTVLYSEPDVGSDLSALTTTATRGPGGGWRLDGRKVYSVKTGYADLGLVAARTSQDAATAAGGAGTSQYQGISLFCVPLAAPGVSVRCLPSLADEDFADVLLTDVAVPESALVGPEGQAWPLITDALALERTGVDYHAKAARWLDLWRRSAGTPDAGQLADFGRLTTSVAAARLFTACCLEQLESGRVDAVFAATTKLWCAETAREVAWWCTQEAGPRGIGQPGRLEAAYREAPGLTISAGTSEMMLELIAGSGLPSAAGDLPGLAEEPLARQLRAAVRALASAYDEHDEHDECDEAPAWWPELARLRAFGLAVPVPSGGLDLGLAASVVVCEELGRGLLDAGVLDTLTAIDALQAADDPAAREALSRALAGQAQFGLVDTHDGVFQAACAEDVEDLLVLGDRAYWCAPRFDAATVTSTATMLRTVRDPTPSRTSGADPDWLRDRDRVRRAAWLTGLAGGAVAEAVARARNRRQFGRTLIENQSVAFTLARLAARLAAARLQVAAAAQAVESAAPVSTAGTLGFACDLAYDATRHTMQLFGAHGMTDRAPAQRFYRTAMVACALSGPVRRLWLEAAEFQEGQR